VELRVFKRSSLQLPATPKNSVSGGSPYGYSYKNGQLVPDKKEHRVVTAIYALWKKGTPLKAIVDHLHRKKILTRMNRKWTQTAIQKIIQRHEEQLNKGK